MSILKIAAILEQNGISKNEFARRLGVPRQTVRPYFRDGYDPKLSTLIKWCIALNCELSDLVGQVKQRKDARVIKGIKNAR